MGLPIYGNHNLGTTAGNHAVIPYQASELTLLSAFVHATSHGSIFPADIAACEKIGNKASRRDLTERPQAAPNAKLARMLQMTS